MTKCEICGKEDVSLLYAEHKDLDRLIKLCRDCWEKAYTDNLLVSGSGGTGGCSCR